MEESSAKRRKTSPTTSIPIDAPGTPSTVVKPVARILSASRPSFASPTKASLSRHNPQLLNKPASSGSGGKNLNDVFARALGETRSSDERSIITGDDRLAGPEISSERTTQENGFDMRNPIRSQKASTNSFGGGMASKPRRHSRSPVKKADKITGPMWETEDTNPFAKKGMRRTPPLATQAEVVINEGLDPFKKVGLRRSPIGSSQSVQSSQKENGILPEASSTPSEPIVSRAEVRRSPVISSQPVEASQKENKVLLEASVMPAVPRGSPDGLRRSPVGSSQPTVSKLDSEPLPETAVAADPFVPQVRIRRSPVGSSQPAESQKENYVSPTPESAAPQTGTTATGRRTGLRKSPVATTPVVDNVKRLRPPVEQSPFASRNSALRRSPIASQTVDDSQKEKENVSIPGGNNPMEDDIPIEPSVSTTPTEPLMPQIDPTEVVHPDTQVTEEPTRPVARSSKRHPPPTEHSKSRVASPEIVESDAATESAIPVPKSSRRLSRPTAGFDDIFLWKQSVIEPEEPDLPPTPIQRGISDPVVTTPPTGIHDTPSKRARRSKALSEKLRSSPLKPRDAPSPSKVAFKDPVVDVSRHPARENEQRPTQPTKQPARQIENSVSTNAQLMPPPPKPASKRRKSIRFLLPEDPYAAKKQERDALLNEIQRLQADVALANAENERLRLRSEARGKAKGSVTAPNQDAVLEMLRRAIAPPQSKPAEKQKSIFKSIDAFLPFRSRRRANASVLDLSERPLPSYLPQPLGDPLPYLQAFTPLTWSSTITLQPTSSQTQSTSSTTSATDQAIIQKHVLTATHPQGFFSSRLSLIVHTPSLTIEDLMILRLPMCAEQELGCFIRPKAKAEGPLGGSVGVITWAMGRWCEVSLRRAGFWCAVESQFGSAEARKRTFGSSKKRKRKRGASVATDAEHNEDTEEEDDADVSSNGVGKWSRKQLLPHLGRSSMEISSTTVELRVDWKIAFDWTGEVESKLGATARIPRTWHNQDSRSSLAKIPEMFDKLVKEKGPLGAVRGAVGLLMNP